MEKFDLVAFDYTKANGDERPAHLLVLKDIPDNVGGIDVSTLNSVAKGNLLDAYSEFMYYVNIAIEHDKAYRTFKKDRMTNIDTDE